MKIENKIDRYWRKFSTYENKKFEVVFFILLAITISSCLAIVLRHSGWPHNHEGLSFMSRSEIYADHFKRGDLLPIWSSNDAYGMGSPLPLFYQKIFYYMSGTVLFVTGSLKFSIVSSLAIFMLTGAYGMRFCVQKVTKQKELILVVPIILLLTNYAFTDWLVRGAMAEFAAMMLVPWVLWWCLKLLIEKEFSVSIAVILFLLINAHNITALFALFPLVTAYALFLFSEKRAGFLSTSRKLLLSVAGLLVLLAPELILQKLFLATYNPSKITQGGYLATEHFGKLSSYFYNPSYVWLKAWDSFSIQIDYGIWIPIIVGALVVALLALTKNKRYKKIKVSQSIGIFLVINLIFFFFLQIDASRVVYEHLKILQFLQFPWRLLVYTTPLGIILVAYFVSILCPPRYLKYIVLAWLASFILLSPLLKTFDYDFLPSKTFSYTVQDNQPSNFGGQLGGIGEYLPRVENGNSELGSQKTLKIYLDLSVKGETAQTISGGPCSVRAIDSIYYEPSNLTVDITCEAPSQIALPISYNDFSTVWDITHNKELEYTRSNPSDPRIIVSVSKTKNTVIKITLPSVVQVLKKLF